MNRKSFLKTALALAVTSMVAKPILDAIDEPLISKFNIKYCMVNMHWNEETKSFMFIYDGILKEIDLTFPETPWAEKIKSAIQK